MGYAELFMSDLHGEYEGFSYALRSCAGIIRERIDKFFSDRMTEDECCEFAMLIYYPHEKLPQILSNKPSNEQEEWFSKTIDRLYMLYEETDEYTWSTDKECKEAKSLIGTDKIKQKIIEICDNLRKVTVRRLHILGDIYDRGPAPDKIIDDLMELAGVDENGDYPDDYERFGGWADRVDIQWGNHDLIWIGAAAGHTACVATVVRICARYGNLPTLEDAYSINIAPLVDFAQRVYADDPCAGFALREAPEGATPAEIKTLERVQKAIAVIQFKVEAKVIDNNPSFNLEDRKLLHRINYDKGTITLDGREYELKDKVFPTVDPADPYALTADEQKIIDGLTEEFLQSKRLQIHINFLLNAGGLYKKHNNNLLTHACVPLKDDGSLKVFKLSTWEVLWGEPLFKEMDLYVRQAFSPYECYNKPGRDMIWYLWLGPCSPLFAKSKMATFEMYFVADKSTHVEVKNKFYSLESADDLRPIFTEFALYSYPEKSHIICGHVPIKVKDGEDPVKCDGQLLMIDGGFSHAYQPKTGIGGFTLIQEKKELSLVAHDPLPARLSNIIENNTRVGLTKRIVEKPDDRIRL